MNLVNADLINSLAESLAYFSQIQFILHIFHHQDRDLISKEIGCFAKIAIDTKWGQHHCRDKIRRTHMLKLHV